METFMAAIKATRGARIPAVSSRTWETSSDVCALRDQERHLGHVVKTGNRWAAYDTTKLNLSCTGFLCLGTFASQAAAKNAVQRSADALGQYDLSDLLINGGSGGDYLAQSHPVQAK